MKGQILMFLSEMLKGTDVSVEEHNLNYYEEGEFDVALYGPVGEPTYLTWEDGRFTVEGAYLLDSDKLYDIEYGIRNM
jgi:hypothetical protein